MTIEFGDYDPDLLDAEIEVERFGIGEFRREDLARFFGIQPDSVWGAVWLLRPDRFEPVPNNFTQEAIWTIQQVAEMLLKRRARLAKCGTPGGYRKHRREATPICEPCRLAHNEANRARRVSA